MGRPPARVTLTLRERAVIDLVGCGLSNAEVATRLAVGPEQVGKHARNAIRKLVLRLTVVDDEGLPPRVRQVFELLGEGLSDAQIAKRLGIGQRSAETLVRKLLNRMEVRRTDVAPMVRGTDRSGMTRREREVADLVRRGMTNAQIAEHLGIGERTVETHVAHALRRLGSVATRTRGERRDGRDSCSDCGGDEGNRTPVRGFADRSLATRARRHRSVSAGCPRGFAPG
jgi:DNA-binding NarL/FixJ family response regulator